MRNVISFPIRTYVDFETLPTSKDPSTQAPNHDGTLVKISVNPATVLTDNHKTELVNFVRRFRQWKWKGSKHVVVPVARAPVDPAHITYNANQPSIDPFDLMLFHAYKRWKNSFQTIPPPSQNFAERYFLMDPSWRKASLLRPFSMFTRPYVNNISQMMQTSHFTIPNGTATDFDPRKLHADTSEPRYDTTNGTPLSHDVIAVQGGFINSQAEDILISSTHADVDEHRHSLKQIWGIDADVGGGVLAGELQTPSALDKLKAFVTGDPNSVPPAKLSLSTRANMRNEARPDVSTEPYRDGFDQANLTGPVNNDDPSHGSYMPDRNFRTSTSHGHDTNVHTGIQEMMAEAHQHYLADEDVATIQTRHTHPINARHLAQGLSFFYDDGRLDPTQMPPQSLPWWSTSSDSFISGRRRVRGWQDTRQASFITGAMTDSVYSPTWPAFLWRIPCHYHTKYAFRMWITHWFSLRSPILHELFVPTTDAVDGMLQEEGVSVLDMKIRTPSAVAGIEGFTPETNEWINSILTNADAEIQQQFTVEPTD